MALADPRNEPRGVRAARMVTIELWTILGEFRDALTLVGGSAPPLLIGEVTEDPYAGTLDVDAIIDPLGVPEQTYRTISERLKAGGYAQDAKNPYRWFREVEVEGQRIPVEVDFLAPRTTGRGEKHRHEVIHGQPLARRLNAADLVRRHFVTRVLEGSLPDGRPNRVTVRVATAPVVIVLKALALDGRDRPKDSYDIDYLLAYADGGIDGIAKELHGLLEVEDVRKALEVLDDKFASVDSHGPMTVARYRRFEPGTAEWDQTRALAYARVRRLLELARQ